MTRPSQTTLLAAVIATIALALAAFVLASRWATLDLGIPAPPTSSSQGG